MQRRELTPKETAARIKSIPERDDLPYCTVNYRFGLVVASWCGSVGSVRVETDGTTTGVFRRRHGAAASCATYLRWPAVAGEDLVAVLRRALEEMCPARAQRAPGRAEAAQDGSPAEVPEGLQEPGEGP